MSGDHGKEEYDEVNVMKRFFAIEKGVKSEDIFMDHAGFLLMIVYIVQKKFLKLKK